MFATSLLDGRINSSGESVSDGEAESSRGAANLGAPRGGAVMVAAPR
jgi:hypothetical protein